MIRTILASASPRRKTLLEQIGLQFEVKPSGIEEPPPGATPPARYAEELAKRKASDVANSHANSLVIGADTIVVQNERILGKPNSHDEARQMLHQLSDASHDVITGVCVIKTDREGTQLTCRTMHERTTVYFHRLEEREVDAYVASGAPMDKAGSYGIQQDLGSLFVRKIEGDYFNVVGLPVQRLYQSLKTMAPEAISYLF